LIDELEEEEGAGFIKEFFLDSDTEATESAVDSIIERGEIEKLRLDKLSPGFITIFGSEIASESAKQKIIEIKNLYRDNLLSPRFAVDHEGGTVQRLSGEGYTKLPAWQELCLLDSDEMKTVLRKSASELRDSGIDIVLAPVLDVGSSRVLKDRICSDSYAVTADRSVQYAEILDLYGILPVIKHFPGIGNTKKDLHTNFDVVEVLINDIKLYKYVVEESPRVGVMVSHAGVATQDPDIPCSLSESCVGEFKTAYSDILVFSDALEMESASYNINDVNNPKDLIQVSKEAIMAGNEVLVYGQSVSSFDMKEVIFNLSREYEINTQFQSLVDTSILKIVDYKYTRR
jgi:beta-glucosidase-like glycosyl hydrolase